MMMEERGRRVEDEQGGVVVIDLRPRENIVAEAGWRGWSSQSRDPRCLAEAMGCGRISWKTV